MTLDAASTTTFILLGGLAIQQALQLLDPLVAMGIAASKATLAKHEIADADAKKATMSVLSFVVALVVTHFVKLRVLTLAGMTDVDPTADQVFTALAIGASTETSNSVVKALEYIKNAKKPGTTTST